MKKELIIDALEKAKQYFDICIHLDKDRFDLLCPEIKDFNKKYLINWGGCPICEKQAIFSNLVKDLFLKIEVELDIKNIIHNVYIPFDCCRLSDPHILDCLYRVLRGDDFNQLILERKIQIENEINELIPVVIKEHKEKFKEIKNSFERQVKLLRKDLDMQEIELEKKFSKRIEDERHLSMIEFLRDIQIGDMKITFSKKLKKK